MSEYQEQLKIQAYLDGELPEAEVSVVARRLAHDLPASALLTELRQTREALAGNELRPVLPESREFYWSKIQREIQRQETPAAAAASRLSLAALLYRLLAPASAMAMLALAALIATGQFHPRGASPETALDDSGAFTYHDYSAGATLVWLSYPAEDDTTDDDDLGSLD
jgi:anti-sigma factor RsiW